MSSDLPNLLSLSEIRSRFKVGRSTIYRWMDHRKFPRPVKLSESVTRWKEPEVMAWFQAKTDEAA